jgi:arylsulfatase A-like enzyme
MRGYWRVVLKSALLISLSVTTFQSCPANPSPNAKPQYNIILIISDQETYHLLPAKNYKLPAREELSRHSVTFTNHYTAAAMCSPSRATLLTGVPPQVHHIYDQEEYPFVPVLDTKRPNMGSVLKQLGYRTAYFGKFEMDKNLLSISDTINYSTLAQPYGFDVFNYDGDIGGAPLQGYTHDPYYVGEAVRWLRKNAKTAEQPPFFMVISLLNPHDIMYGDANIPGTTQAQKPMAQVIFPPPANSLYADTWQFDLPKSLAESLTAKGMPAALNQYQEGWTGTLGVIPVNRQDMWSYYYNYYLNAIRDNDHNLQIIIDTLNQMDLWKETIIIFTADHGEMGGAHGGMRGKGPMAYEENSHIPLIIAHPKAPQGSKSALLTSHLDMLPTLVGLTGLPEATVINVNQQFPGHDFSSVMLNSKNTDIHAIRKGVLFNYVGISTIDGKYLLNMLVATLTHKTLPPLSQINLKQRGFMSFVFDGRYKFARFYSPDNFNIPTTLKDIMTNNDVQLFDLQTDPDEMNNLAMDTDKNKEVILSMNSLLNDLMAKEVGKNTSGFLPKIK